MILGAAGCRLARTENPRVGGSITPLATIQIKALIGTDTNVECPILIGRSTQLDT